MVRGLLVAVASLCASQALGLVGSVVAAGRLRSCGTWATWNLPRLGIEAVSPALAGRFFTTGPPGKSLLDF